MKKGIQKLIQHWYVILISFEGLTVCLLFFLFAWKQSALYTEASSRAEAGAYKIALTFDDGPHPVYTPMLLEGLRKRNIKVSFFVTGQNAEMYPEIIQEMKRDGHLIGNHTYSHMQLTNGNLSAFRDELVKTNQIITQITGQEVNFVRPPYGIWDRSLEKELNMIPVFWTVDPVDWCTSDKNKVVYKTVDKIKQNDIILLHDCYESSVESALEIIDRETKNGFQFVTIDEILFD